MEWLSNEVVNSISNKQPRFVVLTGNSAIGRKNAIEMMAKTNKLMLSYVDSAVSSIREVVTTRVATPTLFVIEFTQSTSVVAYNALLKVTEEPTRNVHIVLSGEYLSRVPEALISRAFVIKQPDFKEPLLRQYRPNQKDVYYKLASTPEELDLLVEYGSQFLEFVDLVVDVICTVPSANAFKSGNKLALGDEGYDLVLFIKTFMHVCLENGKYQEIIVSAPYVRKFATTNTMERKMLYDEWVIAVRRIYL